jgi:small ubiquitin-related modifier
MSSTARVVVKDSKTAVAPVFITLKVVDQSQNRFRHTIRRTAKLQGLMDAWYREVPDVVYGTGTFWLEEISVRQAHTGGPQDAGR